MSSKVKTSKKVKAVPVEEPQEEEPQVEEPQVEEPQEENSENESSEVQDVKKDFFNITNILNQKKEEMKYAEEMYKTTRRLYKELCILAKQVEKNYNKMVEKNSRKKNRSSKNAEQQTLKPIVTQAMTKFIQDNKDLKDKHGDPIFTGDIPSDNEHILCSRKDVIRLVNSYVREKGLQNSEKEKGNGTIINLDDTLCSIFPEYAPKKDKKGKVTQPAEQFTYQKIMKGISQHFPSKN